MTPEAQRIKIAEACGWRAWSRPRPFPPGTLEYEWSNCHPDNQRINGWELTERKDLCEAHQLPRYLCDLNAMHEAEKTLSRDHQFEYHNHIFDLVPCDENHGPCDGGGGEDIMTPSGFSMLHATAAQRAEAFLRTLNLWKEE